MCVCVWLNLGYLFPIRVYVCVQREKTTGVYASESQWSEIMGLGYTGGSRHQLWYAHYDGNPSFSDFRSFGGWTKPAIKQYEGDKSLCGVDVDYDYY